MKRNLPELNLNTENRFLAKMTDIVRHSKITEVTASVLSLNETLQIVNKKVS